MRGTAMVLGGLLLGLLGSGPQTGTLGTPLMPGTAAAPVAATTNLATEVPTNRASHAAQQIITTGRVRRAFPGISYADLDAEVAAPYRLPVRQGVVVHEVVPGSPAAQAGVQVQDIVTAIDDVQVTRGGDPRRVLRVQQPGAVVDLRIVRPTGAATLSARLVESPRS